MSALSDCVNPRWLTRNRNVDAYPISRVLDGYQTNSTHSTISGDGNFIIIGRVFQATTDNTNEDILEDLLPNHNFILTEYRIDMYYLGSGIRVRQKLLTSDIYLSSSTYPRMSLAVDERGGIIVLSRTAGNNDLTHTHVLVNNDNDSINNNDSINDYFNLTEIGGPITTLGHTSISLSNDGSTLAIGSISQNIVHIYQIDTTSTSIDKEWTLTQTANITAPSSLISQSFGYALSLSSDGNTLSVSAPGIYSSLSVFYHYFDGWKQLGSDISIAYPGYSTELSSDGYIVACNGGQNQAASIFSYNDIENEWMELGDSNQNELSLEDGWYGSSVSLSSDGTMLAAHITSQDVSSNANYGSIYHYDDTSWKRVSPELHMSNAPASSNVHLIDSGYSVLFVDSGFYFKLSVACEINQYFGCTGMCAYIIIALIFLFCVATVVMFMKHRSHNNQLAAAAAASATGRHLDEDGNEISSISNQLREERRKEFILKNLITKRIVTERSTSSSSSLPLDEDNEDNEDKVISVQEFYRLQYVGDKCIDEEKEEDQIVSVENRSEIRNEELVTTRATPQSADQSVLHVEENIVGSANTDITDKEENDDQIVTVENQSEIRNEEPLNNRATAPQSEESIPLVEESIDIVDDTGLVESETNEAQDERPKKSNDYLPLTQSHSDDDDDTLSSQIVDLTTENCEITTPSNDLLESQMEDGILLLNQECVEGNSNALQSNDVLEDGDVIPNGSCLICLDDFKIGNEICFSHSSECPHFFHKHCMLDWLQHHNDCPLCRSDFIPDQHVRR